MDSGFKKIRPSMRLSKCPEETKIPEWMTDGKTTLIQKDTQNGTIPSNYKPITWNILTAQTMKEIYYSLVYCGQFLEEQKAYYMGTRGTGNFLYIDQHICEAEKCCHGVD